MGDKYIVKMDCLLSQFLVSLQKSPLSLLLFPLKLSRGDCFDVLADHFFYVLPFHSSLKLNLPSSCPFRLHQGYPSLFYPWRKSGQINQQRERRRNIKQIGIFSRCRTLHTVQDFTANKSAIYLSLTFWVNSTKRLFPSSSILLGIETRVIDTPSVIGCYLFCQFYFLQTYCQETNPPLRDLVNLRS